MNVCEPGHLTFLLAPGEALTVTADAVSAGRVTRLGDSAGDTSQGDTPVIAGATVIVGPFNTPTQFDVIPSAGFLAVTQGYAASSLPFIETPTPGSGDGTNAIFLFSKTPTAVFLNTGFQYPTDDYTVTGATVTFNNPPESGDKVRGLIS